jgi:hypothetical protein
MTPHHTASYIITQHHTAPHSIAQNCTALRSIAQHCTVLHSVTHIYRYSKLGVRGLYRGWVPTCLCRMSNYAYFGPYEYMKRKIAAKQTGTPTLTYKMGTSVLAGATAGLCYWLSCYPMDVIKNRILAAPDVSPPTYVSPCFCLVTSLLALFAHLLPFPAESGLCLPNMACFRSNLMFSGLLSQLPRDCGRRKPHLS